MKETATYNAFVEDIHSQEFEILPEEEVRSKILQIRDEFTSEEQRQQLRNDIICSSIGLIPFVINRKINTTDRLGVSSEELVGEAFEILNKSIDSFNPNFVDPKSNRPVKFSTYAVSCMLKRLNSPKSIVKTQESIRLPKGKDAIYSKIHRSYEIFLQEEGRAPTRREWYEITADLIGNKNNPLSFTEDMFASILNAKSSPARRRKNSEGEEDDREVSTFVRSLVDESQNVEESVIKNIFREELKSGIAQILNTLSDRARLVISLRYGIGLDESGEPRRQMTQSEVAKVLGTSYQNVSFIEKRALNIIENSPEFRNLIKE